MGLDDVKKQVVLLHQAVMMLDLQYRLEAIDFISECCNDLRLKALPYQDVGSDEVLNLTMIKNKYMQFSNSLDYNERFDDFRDTAFCDPNVFHSDPNHYDYSAMDLEASQDVQLLDGISRSPENEVWDNKSETASEAANPVNLVMPTKHEYAPSSTKKSRRKQMFTRKSVRRISGRLHASYNNGRPEKSHDKKGNKKYKAESFETHGPVSCRACRSELLSWKEYQVHKESGKCRPRNIFECCECGDKFKFETHYVRHLAGHKENDCKHCSKKLSSRVLLKKHLKEVHPKVKNDFDLIPCKFCPKSFPRLNRLYSHYQQCHSKGKFVCTSCGLFLPSKEKHKEHMNDHDNEKKWACQICSKKFFNKNNLTKHVKIHESSLYKCITCQINVASKLELQSHKRNKHEVEGLDPKFQCDICFKLFPKNSVLQRHLASHSDTKSYSCDSCVRTFSNLHALTKHRKTKTHFMKNNVEIPESKYEKIYEDLFVCESCGKEYKTYAKLKFHLRIHQTTYQCDLCHTTFNVKENLVRHIKGHNSPKLAVCELCGDSFSRTDGLRDHRLIKHSDVRPVPCTLCPKTFKRKSALNRHMNIHNMVRPYVCYCGRSYKQAAHLRSHQKAAHNKTINNEPKLLENERNDKGYVNSELSLGNFDGHDYHLQETFKQVPYVADDYGDHMGYDELQFGSQPSVSPAVDLSMVSISDVVSRVIGGGLSKPESKVEPEPASIPLVNLSDRVVQEYLLNLP